MLPDLKVKAEPKKALPLLGLGARCFRSRRAAVVIFGKCRDVRCRSRPSSRSSSGYVQFCVLPARFCGQCPIGGLGLIFFQDRYRSDDSAAGRFLIEFRLYP
jgi:hypothetical protein